MTTTDNANLKECGIQAAARFLKLKGYEDIEIHPELDGGYIDIAAHDNGELVLFKVKTHAGSAVMPPDGNPAILRARFEAAAFDYLAASDDVDVRLRFDVISLLIVDGGKAMVRHHVNACAGDDADEIAA